MCAYTNFLIVFSAAFSGLSQGGVALRALNLLWGEVFALMATVVLVVVSAMAAVKSLVCARVLVAGAGFEPTTFGL